MKTIAPIAATLAAFVAISPAAAQSGFKGKLPANVVSEKHRDAIGKTVSPGVVKKIACPDLTVVMGEKRRGGAIEIVYGVRNVGTADFVTNRNRQSLLVKTPAGDRTFAFGNLRVGDVRTWSEIYRPFEFPFTYKGALNFDPDIFIDGNRQNDDCNRSNNQAQLVTSR